MAFCIAIPLALGYFLSWGTYGLSIAIGVLMCSPADVAGNFRHKVLGILAAGFLASVVTLVMGLSLKLLWLQIMATGILAFGVSYLSIYGFRASLVSLAGLLALVLSFARPVEGIDLLAHCSLIFIGSFWYTTMSVGLAISLPVRHTEELLASCIELTAKYLRTTGELAMSRGKNEELSLQLLELQTSISESHETLRDVLISRRTKSGYSNLSRRYLLTFIELVDIMELAVATPFDRDKFHESFKEQPEQIDPLIEITFELSHQLQHIASAILGNDKLRSNSSLDILLEESRNIVSEFVRNESNPEKYKAGLLLKNLYDYQSQQVQKVGAIERILRNLAEKNQLRRPDHNDQKFITHIDYSPKLLIENFSLQSPIVRHSLRLAITLLVGLLIGSTFKIQNTYWILMTIVVIMRPGYGLTRQRSKQRIIGTLIGAAVASAIVLTTQNELVYATLSFISLVFAFSFIQRNYRTAAVFITLSIVFVYALLQPDAFNVIQYRVLDTATGAVLALAANFFLFPAWEFMNIRSFIKLALEANHEYLMEIDRFYHQKEAVSHPYKLSRKQAFLAIGNLNAAFQRMAQEPASKQRHIGNVYQLVSLNSTFLSALAEMGTFIQNHKTNGASEYFEIMIKQIGHNLKDTIAYLSNSSTSGMHDDEAVEQASHVLQFRFDQLMGQNTSNKDNQAKNLSSHLQEARMITDQLIWLHNISSNMSRVASIYQLEADDG